LRQIQRVLREAASLLAGDGGDPDDNQLGGSKR